VAVLDEWLETLPPIEGDEMGTRADFYIGRGLTAEWIGSIAWDGYPSGIPDSIKQAKTEQEMRDAVTAFLGDREDRTLPADGWPWPWENSQTTDYAYAFDGGLVLASCFGYAWFDPLTEEHDRDRGERAVFPDMSGGKQREKFGPHSGIITISRW
jgi:hypothetical protein